MSFQVNCPSCGMSLTVPDDAVGQQGKCSGCGTVFPIEQPYAPPRPAAAPPIGPATVTPGQFRFGDGLSRGFTLMHSNLGTFIGIGAILFGIQMVATLIGCTPYVGGCFSFAYSLALAPVITAGFYRAAFRQHDGGTAEVGDLFAEFGLWVDLFVGTLLSALAGFAAVLIPLIVFVVPIVAIIAGSQGEPSAGLIVLCVALGAIGLLVLFGVAFVVQTAFMWMIPSLLDRRRGFWDAIMTSWNLVKGQFWISLATLLICGMLAGVGVLACGVGVIYTMPASLCCLAAIYRTAVPAPPPITSAASPYAAPPTPAAAWPPAAPPASPPATPGPPPVA